MHLGPRVESVVECCFGLGGLVRQGITLTISGLGKFTTLATQNCEDVLSEREVKWHNQRQHACNHTWGVGGGGRKSL